MENKEKKILVVDSDTVSRALLLHRRYGAGRICLDGADEICELLCRRLRLLRKLADRHGDHREASAVLARARRLDGRNPQTGKAIQIPASKLPTFKASPAFKEFINAKPKKK